MPDVIKYCHPDNQEVYTVDFQDLLPSTDSALNNIGAGSTISAVKSDGTDADSVLASKTRTGKTLTVKLQNLTDGEEYKVTFLAQGTTSSERFTRTVLVLCRRDLTGEF